MIAAPVYPITIAEVATFIQEALKCLSSEERETLIDYLAWHPEAGEVIPGTGGVRKLEWPLKAMKGQPRHRIIYLFRDLNMPLYLLTLYMPGERIVLNARLRAEIEDLAEELVEEHYSQKLARLVNTQPEGA